MLNINKLKKSLDLQEIMSAKKCGLILYIHSFLFPFFLYSKFHIILSFYVKSKLCAKFLCPLRSSYNDDRRGHAIQ